MAHAKITRQWPDGSVVCVEIDSDLDSPEEVATAAASLDREVSIDDEDAAP